MNNTDRQLQWAVILLLSAVILPTVCLLWFMNQAVKNERLVVRQKLMDSYKGQMDLLSRQIDDRWTRRLRAVDEITELNLSPPESFAALAGASERNEKHEPISPAAIVFDTNGNLLYPIRHAQGEFDERPPEQLTEAWNAEFVEENYHRAVNLYSRAAQSYPSGRIGLLASMGKIRCLRKAGDIETALEECLKFVQVRSDENLEPAWAWLLAQGRLLLIQLKKESSSGISKSDYEALINAATDYSGNQKSGYLPLASSSRIFFLRRTIEIVSESQWAYELKNKTDLAQKLLDAEKLADFAIERLGGFVEGETLSKENITSLNVSLQQILQMVENNKWPEQLKIDTNHARELIAALADTNAVSQVLQSFQPSTPNRVISAEYQPKNQIRRIGRFNGNTGYGLYRSTANRIYLFLTLSEKLNQDFDLLKDELKRIGLSYMLTDDTGGFVAGSQVQNAEPFVTASAGSFFPGWQVALYPDHSNVFERAADKQIALYIWTGGLVTLLILLAGVFAARAVGKQIRLNAMKNNFIATVSHELKTPLASMRVLVDTLLEGNYKNQNTVTEYLQLISKENLRLSNLIDNFLSFSRMERNKQAFDMTLVSPVEIINAAADSVRAKFDGSDVLFEVDASKSLPMIEADKDAMITALINLLDNAYKYSRENKQIKLGVFADDRSVCFFVKDNGIGIPRRAIKKIFDRFYQVDTQLSRRSEGCGLGLAIVKFIVDAHKGKIIIESKSAKGSMFTIKIPAERITQ